MPDLPGKERQKWLSTEPSPSLLRRLGRRRNRRVELILSCSVKGMISSHLQVLDRSVESILNLTSRQYLSCNPIAPSVTLSSVTLSSVTLCTLIISGPLHRLVHCQALPELNGGIQSVSVRRQD